MATKTGHAAQVAGNAVLVRHVLAELERRGVPALSPAGAAALALLERWLGGEDVPRAHIDEAVRAAHESGAQLRAEEARAAAWACTAIGNLCWMACRERGWSDANRTILDAACYALASGAAPADLELRAALALLREHATAGAPTVRTKTLGVRLRRPRGLEHLGDVVAARMHRLNARVDPRRTGDAAALRAVLAERQLPAHEALLSFDARYGGIVMADAPGHDGSDWIFGCYACLSSGVGGVGAQGLVPIAASPNDIVYFLDEHGAAWAQDTIEEPEPVPCAPSGPAAVARIVLHSIVFQRRNTGQVRDLPGLHGERIAAAHGLPLIDSASDRDWRAWANPRHLVIEQTIGGEPVTIVASPPTRTTRVSVS